jgi:hypothetical protein
MYQTTRRHRPKDSDIYSHCYKHLYLTQCLVGNTELYVTASLLHRRQNGSKYFGIT